MVLNPAKDLDRPSLDTSTSRPSYTVGMTGSFQFSVATSPVIRPQQWNKESSRSWDNEKWPRTWRAYTSLGGCFFLMFNSWGIINAFGTFLSYYAEGPLQDYDILYANLIGSTQCFVVLAPSFFVGRLLDAGHSRLPIVVGACLTTFGMFMLNVCQGRYMVIWCVQGLVTGLGMACFFVTSSQIATTWFKQTRGFATGIVATGASISGLVYPIMLRFLIRSQGFDRAVLFVGTVVAVTSLAAIFLARPNPRHNFKKGTEWGKLKTWWDMDAFRCPSFLWFTASVCAIFFAFYAVFFNLEEWSVTAGVGIRSNEKAGKGQLQTYYLLAIMNGTSTIGRLSSSYLSDHFGALNVHCVVTLTSALLCFLLWTFANTLPAALAFAVLFGAFSGSVIGLPPASMSQILGKDNGQENRLGQWLGMMYTMASPFALAGPVIAGHLISQYSSSYISIQCWCGGCLLVSAMCMALASYYARDNTRSTRLDALSPLNCAAPDTANDKNEVDLEARNDAA